MERKSISQMLSEHRSVLSTRERLENIFKTIADCHVTVGGSYMLKFWCEAFSEREISDYDFIVKATPDNMKKIRSFLDLLSTQTKWLQPCSDRYDTYHSFYMGQCNGLKCNVILKEVERYLSCCNFETLKDIIEVKKKWCDEAIKQHRKPRLKDIWDIAIYEELEKDNNLPF